MKWREVARYSVPRSSLSIFDIQPIMEHPVPISLLGLYVLNPPGGLDGHVEQDPQDKEDEEGREGDDKAVVHTLETKH